MIKFSLNPLQSDLATLRFVAQKNEALLKALDKTDISNLTDALKKSNLVEKPVLVHGKHGEYWSTRKVNPEGISSKLKPSKTSSFAEYFAKIKPSETSSKLIPSETSSKLTPSKTLSFAEYLANIKPSSFSGFWWEIKNYTKKIGDEAFLKIVRDQGVTWKESDKLSDNVYNAQTAYLEFVRNHPELYSEPKSKTQLKVDNKTQYLKKWKIEDPSPTTTISYNTDFTELMKLDSTDDAKKHFNTENSKSNLKWQSTEKKTIKEYIECTDVPYYANALVRDIGVPDDGGALFRPSDLKGIKKFVDTLDGAIANSELTKPILVHRKVVLYPPMLEALTNFQQRFSQPGGNIFTDKGYCSTTAVESSLYNGTLSYGSDSENQVIFHIKVPAGKGVGAWIAPLAPNKFADQNEFLLPRGTQFKCLTDISKINWKNIKLGEKVHIDLEVIGRKYDSIDTIFHKSRSIDWDYEE